MTRQEAEFQLAELTDAICLRDYSARVQRIRLRQFLGLPTPSEVEVAAEHQRLMDESIKK